MLEINAQSFMRAFQKLDSLSELGTKDPKWLYSNAGRLEHFVGLIRGLHADLWAMNLPVSVHQAHYLEVLVTTTAKDFDDSVTAASARQAISILHDRIVDELDSRSFYIVPESFAILLKPVEVIYDEKVAKKLNRVLYDLEEAPRCIAFGRGTAAVFHLMRAMEHAVVRLGRKLRVTIIDKNNRELEWGKIISNLSSKIEGMDRGDKRDRWSATVSNLYHVKQAWRNNTMHPKQTYTESEALQVFVACQTFLKDLARMI